jgi:hypothetical protein
MVLLTISPSEDQSCNLNHDEIATMAAAGIKYTQSTILPQRLHLRLDRFVEVRLERQESDHKDYESGDTIHSADGNIIHLFDVLYKRNKLREKLRDERMESLPLDARPRKWILKRAKEKSNSELKRDLLHPKARRNLAHYIVLHNGELQRVS